MTNEQKLMNFVERVSSSNTVYSTYAKALLKEIETGKHVVTGNSIPDLKLGK